MIEINSDFFIEFHQLNEWIINPEMCEEIEFCQPSLFYEEIYIFPENGELLLLQ